MNPNFLIGIIVIFACTLGGFIMAGGHMGVLIDAAPLEILIMGGTAAGAFIISNPPNVKKATAQSLKHLFSNTKFNKDSYIELLSMMLSLIHI